MEKKAFCQFLLERYANGIASEEEVQELFAELEKRTDEQEWEEMINQVFLQTGQDLSYDKSYWHPVIESILAVREIGTPVRNIRLKRWLVAASVIAVMGVSAYLWWQSNNKEQQQKATIARQEIKAGSNGAVLTLADGSTIVLDSLGNGVIAEEQGAAAAVLQDGKLSYKPSGEHAHEIVYNTMTTPRGRQFRMSLPDGTQVWLNSASSIRYPTAFIGKERKVEISGEAFFEVKQKANQPFIVQAGSKAEIQVLGTDFNVNAYNNEPSLNTTLLDGAVKVNGRLLKPGQQAKISTDQSDYVQLIEGIDINKVMAWKNGRFSFEGATIEEIMRQIERWYDVDVVFEGKRPRVEFEGQMTRNVSLNGLIAVMKRSGVNMRLEGRTLIVLP
ncbi:FecR family protein [Pseudobacter ginsenosidimutans]|uniref:FecR family protein n=1 Tax=Pseudobacter ginsenosidimutans TaxID=661488 RepID=A0A4V2F0R6_9BACT|nr:FecR family protein [Pseudobacter ginsenosidimutans]RZS71061.1 FecR family protein [Pseudobacter ginsenosidimutans]